MARRRAAVSGSRPPGDPGDDPRRRCDNHSVTAARSLFRSGADVAIAGAAEHLNAANNEIDHNRVINNAAEGIFYEISQDAVMRLHGGAGRGRLS